MSGRRLGTRATRMAWLAAPAIALATLPAAAASPWANVADPVFQRIDQKALPHPAVYAVTQDGTGYLWIGGPGGLARYDGYQFRSYLPNHDRPDAPAGVDVLLADGRGRLWIGTPSSGLVAFDEATETFRAWRPDPAGRRGPRSATVIALATSASGELWVGGDRGLDLFDPRRGEFAAAELEEATAAQPRVEAVLVDRRETVWVATVHGLFFRPAHERAFRRFTFAGGEDSAASACFSLYEDGGGRLWVGGVNALRVLGPDPGRELVRTYVAATGERSLAPGEQWAITEVTPGTFWVAVYGGGISLVDDAAQRVRRMAVDRANPGGFTPGDVWRFFRDRSGLVWVANGPGGLLAHNPRNAGIYSLSASGHRVRTGDIGARALTAAADGALWLGGGETVIRLDPRSGETTSFAVPNHASVQTLHAGADGTLWIGTVKGICRLSPGRGALDCPHGLFEELGRVFAIVELDGKLWVGTGTGLAAVEPASGVVTRYRHGDDPATLSNDFVTVLAAGRDGQLWGGTTNGLNRFDPRTGRAVRFVHDPRDARSLAPGAVSSIVQDRRGRIWVGSQGGPLSIVGEHSDGGFDVRRLGAADGVPENVAGLALGADGRVWASVTSVVASIDPESFATRLFGPAEGVQENEFWTRGVARAADGTVFFAGTNAVTVIAPGANAEWSYAPPLAITALRGGGRDFGSGLRSGGTALELPAGSRDLSVEFAAFDFSSPAAIRYAYTLDGYRAGWTETDAAHRTATYTNLPPGRYTLRVRATDRLGAWSASTIALPLRALPAWYETWWSRALLAVLLAAGVVALVRARTAVLRRRAERLEAVVAARTSELAQANAALEDLTITDPLTGLRNRRFFLQRIEDDVALALRQGTDLVFFLVDVDHFKKVNDELGHAAGDLVLRQMRGRLEQVFRASDSVLRWGGEEFLAVARGSARADAPEIAERLRATIAGRPFELDGGQLLQKTASIGFAAFPFVPSARRDLSWNQVVQLADQALYMAKRGGRDTWVGLTATTYTDTARLSALLSQSPEEAVDSGGLQVVRPLAIESGAALRVSG